MPLRDADLARVRSLPLFAGMDGTGFATLMRAAFLQRFPARVELIAEGDPADFLYVVLDGAIELYARAGRRETTLSIERPVSTFILAAVMRDAVYLMSARTIEAAALLMIPAESVRERFGADAAFARAMVFELARGFRGMVRELKNQKLRAGAERLANHLLRLDAEAGGTGRVVLPMEKRLLASLLGMTPESLSRAFATLAAHGLRVQGAGITIVDRPALVRFAGPTPLIDDPQV